MTSICNLHEIFYCISRLSGTKIKSAKCFGGYSDYLQFIRRPITWERLVSTHKYEFARKCQK